MGEEARHGCTKALVHVQLPMKGPSAKDLTSHRGNSLVFASEKRCCRRGEWLDARVREGVPNCLKILEARILQS
jgi:hypothetical protein